MTTPPRTVAVVGGGRMGAGIAQSFAAAGSAVTVVECGAEAAAAALERIGGSLRRAGERGHLSEPAERVAGRVSVVRSMAALPPETELLVEAVPEDAALKARLLKAAEEAVGDTTVLATNTSSLSVTDLAAVLRRPDRFLGMHFFNPVPASALVEIVVAPGTAAPTVEAALEWTRALGKQDVVVKDSPGFASSRLGLALGLEAIRMVEEGVAVPEAIDDAMRLGWINDPVPPATSYDVMPGRWVGDDNWPSPKVTWSERTLAAGSEPVLVRSPLHTGLDAGRFFPFGNAGDLPPDQREEDGRSVCFDSEPLAERVEILGRPRVRLRLDSATPRANVIVRLCDVAPDGSSTLVTRGVLNLLSRHGRDRTVEWTPGTYEDVEIELTGIGYAFPPGHSVRVAVSDVYWPWVWPHGERGELRVVPADSAVLLPVRAAGEEPPIAFEEPEQAPPLPVTHDRPAEPRPARLVTHDVAAGEWTLEVDPNYGGSRTYPDGLRYEESARETYRVRGDDPLSASAVSEWRIRLRRGEEYDAEIMARTELRASAADFVMDSRIEARANGETVVKRSWHHTSARTSG
ncbi:3-hydroxyacyl-CoA dehydrogenase NAD-binding domain-containing protein [Streptomyces sp. NPDC005921]